MKDPMIVDGFAASVTQESIKRRHRLRNVFPPLDFLAPDSRIGDMEGPVDNFLVRRGCRISVEQEPSFRLVVVLVFGVCSVNKEAKFSGSNSGVFSELYIIEFEVFDLGAVESLSSNGFGKGNDGCPGVANKFIM